VLPRSFLMDNDETFISWEGFYQDCDDPFSSKNLQWTIGVSKLKNDPKCIMTDGSNPVSFIECTTPTTIFYQGGLGRGRALGYSGFALSLSPAKRRIFYLTVIDHVSDIVEGKSLSEFWVMPEGAHHAKNPNALITHDSLRVDNRFQGTMVEDVATIRLQLDANRVPRALCRTAYDAGVFCYRITMEDDGDKIDFRGDLTFSVTAKQVAESCTLPESSHYNIERFMSPVSTGLEVVWGNDGVPDMLFFGCYGELTGHGNVSTAFRNGTVVQTLKGAYPGSILFGADLPEPSTFVPSIYPNQNGKNEEHHSRHYLLRPLSSLSLFILLTAGVFLCQKSRSKRRSSQEYERVLYEDEKNVYQVHASDTGVFVELTSLQA
jgi:hypothetical protein